MGGRVNTIMQTAFFAISGALPREKAIAEIKRSIKQTYGKRGEAVERQNERAVDETLEHLYEVDVPRMTMDDGRWTLRLRSGQAMDDRASLAASESSSI